MSYSANSPQDLPPPNIAVDQIRANFNQFANSLAASHTPMNDENQGKHEAVIFQALGSTPSGGNTGDNMWCERITNSSPTSTAAQLFMRVPAFGGLPALRQQLTYDVVNTAGPVYQSFTPGIFLTDRQSPSCYLWYFGQASFSSPASSVDVTLTPAPRKILCIIANPQQFNAATVPGPKGCSVLAKADNTGFTIFGPNNTNPNTFTWIALGAS